MVLLIARHDARKGIPFLLEAFALLNKENIPYTGVIVGDGPFLRHHQRYAARLHLPRVYFTGAIGDPVALLKRAAVFVFPSLEEGGSALSVLEAMRYGLPIVATRVDGIPEDIDHGNEGLLVPPKDPNQLAEAIRRLLENRRLARRLGRNARARFQREHGERVVRAALKHFLITIP